MRLRVAMCTRFGEIPNASKFRRRVRGWLPGFARPAGNTTRSALAKVALHRPNGSAEHSPGMREPKANDSLGYQPHHFPCTPKWVRESGWSPQARCSSIDPHLLAPPWGAGDFWMCRVPGNRFAHPRAGVSAPVGGVVSEQPTIPLGLTTMRLHPLAYQAVRGNRRPRPWLNLELAPPVPQLYRSAKINDGIRICSLWP